MAGSPPPPFPPPAFPPGHPVPFPPAEPPVPAPRQGPGPRDRQGPRHRSMPTQRAGGPVPEAPRAPEDVELDSYLAALAPDAGPEATTLTGRFGHAQVFQLRLPALRIEQLRRIAEERGVSPGALAVDWVVERLDREDTPTGPFAVVEQAEQRRRGPLRNLRRRSKDG